MFPFQTGSIRSTFEGDKMRDDKGFPFQTGSIRSVLRFLVMLTMLCFHSKLVRLEVVRCGRSAVCHHGFPFQTGSIRRGGKTWFRSWSPRFNSKLVRLEENAAVNQWHLHVGFHSKLVRLEVWITWHTHGIRWGFHSKLVRLEVSYLTPCQLLSRKFPFQTGAIRRHHCRTC